VEAEPGRPARGWFLQLVLRLTLIGVVLVVALLAGLYWLARSL
jgi:hypothetical protein